MIERRPPGPRLPLTADLAGVLEAARHEQTLTIGRGAVSLGGVGAAVAGFVRNMAGRVQTRRASTRQPQHVRSVSS
jgi:hypothetical protein